VRTFFMLNDWSIFPSKIVVDVFAWSDPGVGILSSISFFSLPGP
jgi:hypothetical protein